MAETREVLRRRRWADVVVIAVAVFELMLTMYGALLARPGGVAFDLQAPGWYYAAMSLSGVLALAAVLIAIRLTTVARILCAAAGVLLLTAVFAFESIDLRTVLTIILPGVLLLGATPFLGPMPSPEEEGMRR